MFSYRNEADQQSEFRYPGGGLQHQYIKQSLANLTINIIGDLYHRTGAKDVPAYTAGEAGQFAGWCYQVVNFCSPFLENSSVSRGKLRMDGSSDFEHAWINFDIRRKPYIFDPAFGGILADRDQYHEQLVAEELIQIPGIAITKEIISICDEYENNPQVKEKERRELEEFNRIYGDIARIDPSEIPKHLGAIEPGCKLADLFYNTLAKIIHIKVDSDRISELAVDVYDAFG